jgi:hypothetical protein
MKRRVMFSSEQEAYAFIQGLEFVNNDIEVDGVISELDSEGNDEYAVYLEEMS